MSTTSYSGDSSNVATQHALQTLRETGAFLRSVKLTHRIGFVNTSTQPEQLREARCILRSLTMGVDPFSHEIISAEEIVLVPEVI
jgi:hypothetical protein